MHAYVHTIMYSHIHTLHLDKTHMYMCTLVHTLKCIWMLWHFMLLTRETVAVCFEWREKPKCHLLLCLAVFSSVVKQMYTFSTCWSHKPVQMTEIVWNHNSQSVLAGCTFSACELMLQIQLNAHPHMCTLRSGVKTVWSKCLTRNKSSWLLMFFSICNME